MNDNGEIIESFGTAGGVTARKDFPGGIVRRFSKGIRQCPEF
jgi:hypothetical protein